MNSDPRLAADYGQKSHCGAKGREPNFGTPHASAFTLMDPKRPVLLLTILLLAGGAVAWFIPMGGGTYDDNAQYKYVDRVSGKDTGLTTTGKELNDRINAAQTDPKYVSKIMLGAGVLSLVAYLALARKR